MVFKSFIFYNIPETYFVIKLIFQSEICYNVEKEEVINMISKKYIKSAFVLVVCAIALTTSNICADKVTAEPVAEQRASAVVHEQNSTPLDIVNHPKFYLDKTVVFNAKFDKFSTLGLDYKPAFKSSEDYISFLIKRDDTTYDIPLSEMKLFLKRSEAEKFIDLKTNDEVQISGTVFSDALGDAWIDVNKLVVVSKAPEKDGVK